MKNYAKPSAEVIDLSRKSAILTSGDCVCFTTFECLDGDNCPYGCSCDASTGVGDYSCDCHGVPGQEK